MGEKKKMKYCCESFKEAYQEGTFAPIYGSETRLIETRGGGVLPLPKVDGYQLMLVDKYDFIEGYGETRKIIFCPFCGKRLGKE